MTSICSLCGEESDDKDLPCNCQYYDDYFDDNTFGMSLKNVNKELGKIVKQDLLDNWEWLSYLVEPDEIPDELVNYIISYKLTTLDKVLVSHNALRFLVDIINCSAIGFSASIVNNHLILKGKEEILDDIKDLKGEIEEYLETKNMLNGFASDSDKRKPAF